jgi:hypothetical protein
MTVQQNQSIRVVLSLISMALVIVSCAPSKMPADTMSTVTESPAVSSAEPMPVQSVCTPVPPELEPAENIKFQTLWLYNPSGVRTDGFYVDWLLKKTMDEGGIEKPPLASQSDIRVEMMLSDDPYPEVTELFYQRGWTDGLPIVPPTEEAVAEMLTGTDLPREQIVATLDPMGGQATIEKIAVNAVMAGCRPEYLPILIAAVEAIADPVFELDGVGTTTNPDATMIIVNGPIAKQLDINSGPNALGRGWTANATIGRALHLIEQNIGGSWAGVSDASSLGMPGDYSMMLAENETANPWQPLHVELGFAQDQNVVTVVSAEGMQRVLDIGVTGEGFLGRVANYVSGRDNINRNMLLILTPYTAQHLVMEGWNKDSIREYIYAHSLVTQFRYQAEFLGEDGILKDANAVMPPPDANGMVPVQFIDQLTILVAGGIGEKNELIPMWSRPVSREIKLPSNWDEILANAAE